MNRKKWILLGSGVLVVLVAALLIFVDFDNLFQKTQPTVGQPITTPAPEETPLIKETVLLYFAADEGNFLLPEERTVAVSSKNDLPLQVIKELIKGPKTPALSPVLHPETVVLQVAVEGDLATANFNETILTLNTGGSTRETMCLYSIVNSLCELPGIKRVQFAVNGQVITTFGQFDFSEPYEKNLDIIKINK